MPRNGASWRRTGFEYDAFYKKDGSLAEGCRYCGAPAWTWDHVPPLHYVERLTRIEVDNLRLRKIPCCSECNSWLGSFVLITIKDRLDHVIIKFRERYKMYIDIPKWAEDELTDLGPGMRKYVDNSVAQHIAIRKRWEILHER